MAASGNAAPTTTAELASAIEQARWLLDATFERQRLVNPGRARPGEPARHGLCAGCPRGTPSCTG
jgi:hypothetical protein